MKQNGKQEEYIPAVKYDWLTWLYDPLVRITTREKTFKRRFLQQARIQNGHRVLDLGCGTATLTIMIKEACPEAEVFGVDGDPKILGIAKAKVQRTNRKIQLDQGMSYQLPYPDNHFDRVLSSLVFHHLSRDNKIRTFQEVLRVLRPGGEMHIADFGVPQGKLMRIISRFLSRFERTADNIQGLLPVFAQQAGFIGIQSAGHFNTIYGTVDLFQAVKPS